MGASREQLTAESRLGDTTILRGLPLLRFYYTAINPCHHRTDLGSSASLLVGQGRVPQT